MTEGSLIDENCSPTDVRKAITKAIRPLTGHQPKRSQRKGKADSYIYSGIGKLPTIEQQPVTAAWFSVHLNLVSPLHRAEEICQHTHIVEISHGQRGHKQVKIDLSQCRITSISIKGDDINLCDLPNSITKVYDNSEELLLILNTISNMSICANFDQRSPSCAVFVTEGRSCQKCQKVISYRKSKVAEAGYERGKSDLMARIYAVGDEFGKFVDDQLRRQSLPSNASYDAG